MFLERNDGAQMSLQNRIRWRWFVPLAGIVVALTYVDFVATGPPTGYDVVGWLLVVPLVLAGAVDGVTGHRWYVPALYGALVVIGLIRYLSGHGGMLTVLFVVAGVAGLVDWATPGSWFSPAENGAS